MSYPTRIYYTDAQKKEMWDRWQKGESMNAIGRLFSRSHSSIQGILSKMFGMAPTPRKRLVVSLTLAEGEEISRGVVAGCSFQSIAVSLRRATSTVSREVNRNGGKEHYRASEADLSVFK